MRQFVILAFVLCLQITPNTGQDESLKPQRTTKYQGPPYLPTTNGFRQVLRSGSFNFRKGIQNYQGDYLKPKQESLNSNIKAKNNNEDGESIQNPENDCRETNLINDDVSKETRVPKYYDFINEKYIKKEDLMSSYNNILQFLDSVEKFRAKEFETSGSVPNGQYETKGVGFNKNLVDDYTKGYVSAASMNGNNFDKDNTKNNGFSNHYKANIENKFEYLKGGSFKDNNFLEQYKTVALGENDINPFSRNKQLEKPREQIENKVKSNIFPNYETQSFKKYSHPYNFGKDPSQTMNLEQNYINKNIEYKPKYKGPQYLPFVKKDANIDANIERKTGFLKTTVFKGLSYLPINSDSLQSHPRKGEYGDLFVKSNMLNTLNSDEFSNLLDFSPSQTMKNVPKLSVNFGNMQNDFQNKYDNVLFVKSKEVDNLNEESQHLLDFNRNQIPIEYQVLTNSYKYLHNPYEENNYSIENNNLESQFLGNVNDVAGKNYNKLQNIRDNNIGTLQYEFQPSVEIPGAIQKHFYIFVPPPVFKEEVQKPFIPVQPVETHYNIIFIKTPTEATPAISSITLPPQKQEKTVVYLLVKQPNELEAPRFLPPLPAHINKPEVHYITYRTEEELEKLKRQDYSRNYFVINKTSEDADGKILDIPINTTNEEIGYH